MYEPRVSGELTIKCGTHGMYEPRVSGELMIKCNLHGMYEHHIHLQGIYG